MVEPTHALSIRSPWWWFILHGGKDIENRNWSTRFRGPVYIHASKWFGKEEIRGDCRFAKSICQQTGTAATLPPITWDGIKEWSGALVGTVDIIDCVQTKTSPWFFGRYGFVLANPKPLDAPIPLKGALGFFKVGEAGRG